MNTTHTMTAGRVLEQNKREEQTWELLISTRSAVEDSLHEKRLNTIPTLTALSMVRAALRHDYETLDRLIGDIYREAING